MGDKDQELLKAQRKYEVAFKHAEATHKRMLDAQMAYKICSLERDLAKARLEKVQSEF